MPNVHGEEKTMIFDEAVKNYIESSLEETYALLESLARIPAPSHHEEARARFCKEWLEKQGAKGVYIDEALNVIYPMNCEGCDEITVFMAHTDVVFPDTEELPFSKDEKNFYAPGIGDDTASVVVMLMTVKYLLLNGLMPKKGLLFVANSCEEGLGNLKGSMQIMKDFSGRIKELYTFDGRYNAVVDRCVGSYRYEIECRTEGGHSFGNFGNANAIVELSRLICKLYELEIPEKENTKTTFNVGSIKGGTSVNTIAQYASCLYEYRSDDVSCITRMTEQFEAAMRAAAEEGRAEFSVRTVGIRPCGSEDVPKELHEEMIARVIEICKHHTGEICARRSGSTDCNSPMSMGVPAVCLGCYMGGGAHTREEFVEIASLETGMKIAAELILCYF